MIVTIALGLFAGSPLTSAAPAGSPEKTEEWFLAATVPGDDAPLAINLSRSTVLSLRSGHSVRLPGLREGSRYTLAFSPLGDRFLLTDLTHVFVVAYPSLRLLKRHEAEFAFWRGEELGRLTRVSPQQYRLNVGKRSRLLDPRWRPFAVSPDARLVGLVNREAFHFEVRGLNADLSLSWIAPLGASADDATSGVLLPLARSTCLVALTNAILGQRARMKTLRAGTPYRDVGIGLDMYGWGGFSTRFGVLVEGESDIYPETPSRLAVLVTAKTLRSTRPSSRALAVYVGGKTGRFGELRRDAKGRLSYSLRPWPPARPVGLTP